MPPTIATSLRCDSDEWSSTRALAEIRRDGGESEISATIARLRAGLVPMERERLRQRLTILGSAMAPGRSSEDGAAWLAHMTGGLRDLPEDILLEAIDEWVKANRWLPQVSELRELADPKADRRRRELARLDAIERLIASGADVPPAAPVSRQWPPQEPEPWDEAKRCTPEQAAAIMAEFGLKAETRETLRRHLGPPRMPTAADYAALGVDPADIPNQEMRDAA